MENIENQSEKFLVVEWFDFEFAQSSGDQFSYPTLKDEELHPFAHQVAGHRFEEGRPGSLVDSHGRFYKPSQSKERGDSEISFYENFWKNSNEYRKMKMFFPLFYGTVKVKALGGQVNEYAVLENLVQSYVHPCIIDIKIGKRTWYEGASEAYIIKCLEKDKISTSNELGFRIAGIQLLDRKNEKLVKGKRKWCQRLQKRQVRNVLRNFVSSDFHSGGPELKDDVDGRNYENRDMFSESDVDRCGNADLARHVYGGPCGVLAQLKSLQKWFEFQTKFHFFSSSLLIIYEGNVNVKEINNKKISNNKIINDDIPLIEDLSNNPFKVKVKCIDFPHVLFDNDKIDENFLFGLDSLVDHLSQIV